MLERRALILLVSCFAVPAQAGLFSDDEARKQIQQVEGRVLKLEERVPVLEERVLKLEDAARQHTKSSMDLQGQIEALNTEIRKLRGQNEELAHGLQDAEKREKDFYVDLDTRLRHFESLEEAAAAEKAAKAALPVVVDTDDPAAENRAFETAYGLFKSGNHADAVNVFQAFINKHPESAHLPNAHYWLGNAQFELKDYKIALGTYQGLLKAFPDTPKAAEVLFNIAGCQQELKQNAEARKTLKQLVAKYPASEAAAKAKKLLTTAR
ncbi:MAG: tol-pal system protein YbgF [Gallionella sp.]|nr:MAG: tol-pal system protein YbgF [Gallionella sp.]